MNLKELSNRGEKLKKIFPTKAAKIRSVFRIFYSDIGIIPKRITDNR